MIGGDERAALHNLLAAIAAGDWVGTHANLATLLVALGRTEAAELVQDSAVVEDLLRVTTLGIVLPVDPQSEFVAIL
jgi:hypothetical protein